MPPKSKLTEALMAQIAGSLQKHNSVKSTCELVRISEQTFYRWMQEGEAARSGRKREFYELVNQAKGFSKDALVNKIASHPHWRGAAWLLERQHPKEFGQKQMVAHTNPDFETPLEPTTNQAVVLNIKMEGGQSGESPWTYREGQDSDEEDESVQHGIEVADWRPQALPEPEPEPEPETIKPPRPPIKGLNDQPPPQEPKAVPVVLETVEASTPEPEASPAKAEASPKKAEPSPLRRRSLIREPESTNGKPRDPDA